MFFRIKKIKGKEYVYIVENKWQTKGSRQKVKGYIGRAYRFGLKNEIGFLQFIKAESLERYISNAQRHKIISDLVEWEIFKFGISRQEFSIDLNERVIQKNKKNAVFLVNDGFMCSLTLKNLLDFKAAGDEQKDAHLLARAFVELGIKVPKEVFIGLYEKF